MVIYQKFAVALSEFLTVCMLQGHESYIRNPPGQKELHNINSSFDYFRRYVSK